MVRVRQTLLHGVEVLSSSIVHLLRLARGAARDTAQYLGAFRLPEREGTVRVTHDQHRGVVSYFEGCDANEGLVHLPELSHFLSLEVPHLDLARLVSKDDLDLVRM